MGRLVIDNHIARPPEDELYQCNRCYGYFDEKELFEFDDGNCYCDRCYDLEKQDLAEWAEYHCSMDEDIPEEWMDSDKRDGEG